jgi:biotin carboxylase
MLVALDEFEIEGVANTISFHKYILNNRDFYNGRFSTAFVEKYYDDYLNKIKLAAKKKA